jgi:hypothetical protein
LKSLEADDFYRFRSTQVIHGSVNTEKQLIIQPSVLSGMKSWSSALIGLGIGAVLGYLFGIRRGDWWIGGSIAVTSSIAAYGFLAYPQYRFKWSGPHSKFWYTLFSVLAPVIMLLTPISPLLPDDLPIVALLGSIWTGGVYAGVALAHESPDTTDNEAPSSSPSG